MDNKLKDIREALAERVRQYLTEKSREPIVGADEHESFPKAGYSVAFTREPVVIVIDTNQLLPNIATACKRNERTILVTSANVGAVRLFCADHVINEVYDHAEQFASRAGVSREVYIARFESEYLPLIRYVPSSESLASTLTPAESKRISGLRSARSKDVPSAILSIALNAHYLTRDRPAFAAAYGRSQSTEEFEQQTELLKSAGDADTRGQILFYFALLASAGWSPFGELLGMIPQRLRWIAWCAGGAAISAIGFAAWRNRNSVKSLGLVTLESFLALYEPLMHHVDHVSNLGPGEPAWELLASDMHPRDALLRAIAHRLARHQLRVASARELSRTLPALGVGQGERIIRDFLP